MISRVCRRVLFSCRMLAQILTTLRAINFEFDRAVVKGDILLATAQDIRTTLSEASAEADRVAQKIADLTAGQGGISIADSDAINSDAQALRDKIRAL